MLVGPPIVVVEEVVVGVPVVVVDDEEVIVLVVVDVDEVVLVVKMIEVSGTPSGVLQQQKGLPGVPMLQSTSPAASWTHDSPCAISQSALK